MDNQESERKAEALGSDVERGVRRDLPFLGLLSPEKTEAIIRGERVEITAEESGMFRAQMNLIHEHERTTYREALEKIALKRRDYAPTLESCQRIAREALGITAQLSS